jgi:hypothetical protein
MSSPRLSCSIRIALAAVLAVVTTMPPAMGHAHEGGDRPHEHGHADHAEPAHGPAVLAAASAAGGSHRVSHVHLVWLGMHLTFAWPVSAPASGPAEHVVVRLLDPAAPAPVVAALDLAEGGWSSWIPPVASTSIGDLPRPEAIRRALAAAPPAALLCDTARHERSGVQLS